MKQFLLPALLALSSIAVTTSSSSEAQASQMYPFGGLLSCTYSRHGEDLYTDIFPNQTICPQYPHPEEQAAHYKKKHDDPEMCTVDVRAKLH